MEMNLETNLDTKLTQLSMAVKRTGNILDAGKRESIKRHLGTLQTIIKEANQCKGTVEAQKISNKEDISKIDEWNVEIEGKLEIADNEVTRLEQWLAENERNEKFVAQEELFKLEMAMHQKKLKMQAELSVPQKQPEAVECEASGIKIAKLPKLVISKFDGSYMDWPRFWGQFVEAIDKSSIAPISKLTYLLELLEPNVKCTVEALPIQCRPSRQWENWATLAETSPRPWKNCQEFGGIWYVLTLNGRLGIL
jgi:hypothetical protein